jgi:Mrp family chromosome partitioning ATPase
LGRKVQGLSNYLADPSITVGNILHKEFLPNVDLIPAGTIAPNPAELLMSDRLDALVAQMRD